ncbi:retrovirus-related Pol polyprotein from transposon 412 [Betta splendens]|uniref:Gypsy retrotransposon integrase-like protein 1 n=1 Tax=Betta splendens TaxID=158456 RepID=A0A9W2XKB5_BETSP|nr:retrovirus-related Pol polyprotein from transposon 412 [Betta splendens]
MLVNRGNTETYALVERPATSTLPGGVFVDSSLISLPNQGSQKLAVFLRNEADHDIVLPTNCVIADFNVANAIIENYQAADVNGQNVVERFTQQNSKASSVDKESLSETFDFGPTLPDEWKGRVTHKLNGFSDVFAQHDLDFGHGSKIQHHIRLKDETPFKQRSRPIHPRDYEAVKKHLQTLLSAGIIGESESPFSSPIVVVRKKDGDVRLCVDYRKLNLQTIKDAYALPLLEESFSVLAGSKWFSVMDLKAGYYQIEMNNEDKPKTAFCCPFGFYEFNRMPQGITNAPSTFQRLMEKCMNDINLKEVLVFLDDIIVFSETLEEHEIRLVHVLDRLREYGLKLSPKKCKFFQSSVHYLGHVVSSNGVKTDPKKTEALKTWPRPQNLKELESFLGFTGYYRRFVKDYSQVVKPLTNLTAGYPPRRKGTEINHRNDKYLNPREAFGDRWSMACQEAFEEIKDRLTSTPVLGYADSRLPYVLHTDASTTGLGAALYQEQEGETRVIAYASRGLSRSEARYPAHKLEFLALKWAVTEKFHDYLYGNDFTVITDNNPLTYLLTTAKLDAVSYRWLAALSTFTFNIKYRAGKQNVDADGLSRRPHGPLENDAISQEEGQRIDQFTSQLLASTNEVEQVTPGTVKAVCQRHTVEHGPEPVPFFGYVESLAIHTEAIPDVFAEEESQDGSITVPKYNESALVQLQKEDPVISKISGLMENGTELPADCITDSPEVRLILREWKRLQMKSGLLYRTRKSEGETSFQLVLPAVLRPIVLKNLHDEMGHLGIERTLELTRSRFYWPKMAADIERKVKTCERCVRRKVYPDNAAPLVNIQTSRPMELVCMDFLSLEPDNRNTRDILVVTDHFTKYAIAIPTRDQKATTVAKALWENVLVHYGFPERLHSDQGRDFESHTIKELCALTGTHKVRTSPYHPRGNPVERYNRTLLSMLGTLEDKNKTKWREYVKPLTHAYNCTRNDVTGFSPYELMFGRQPRLPIDIAFGLPVKAKESSSHSQYVRNLKFHLEESYQTAIKKLLQDSREKQEAI